MPVTRTLAAGLALFTLSYPAFAEMRIQDAYMRTSGAMAKSGAAFMVLENTGPEDDRLVAAASEIAARVELHTHKDIGDGIMQMSEVEDGVAIPAGGQHVLARGGDHVMFMGLTGPVAEGDIVTVTLTFEKAGDIAVDIPVDLTRGPGMGGMQHMGGS
jgi:copper(I)-binding protein